MVEKQQSSFTNLCFSVCVFPIVAPWWASFSGKKTIPLKEQHAIDSLSTPNSPPKTRIPSLIYGSFSVLLWIFCPLGFFLQFQRAQNPLRVCSLSTCPRPRRARLARRHARRELRGADEARRAAGLGGEARGRRPERSSEGWACRRGGSERAAGVTVGAQGWLELSGWSTQRAGGLRSNKEKGGGTAKGRGGPPKEFLSFWLFGGGLWTLTFLLKQRICPLDPQKFFPQQLKALGSQPR